MKAKWIKTDGTMTEVEPKNGTDFQLDELQKFVGGYIEVVYPPSQHGAVMIVNEEGKLRHLPINKLATASYYPNQDVIVGDVLLCHTSQLN
jgi:Domain of unknown function (DUF3846)